MAELYWLKRPIAHRGLHDAASGVIENSAAAVTAALGHGYAIEVDLQCAAGRMPVVFHDATLDRLTGETGAVADREVEALRAIPLRGTTNRILSLPDLLALVGGYVPLVLEVKSTWTRDGEFEANIAGQLASYDGPIAVMSFDPYSVAAFREVAPALPRGLIGCRFAAADHWADLSHSPALRHAASPHIRLRTAPLHRLRYRGAAGGRAAHRQVRVRAAAADLDRADRSRSRARASLCRRHDLRRDRALSMGDVERDPADAPQLDADEGVVVRVSRRIADVPASDWDACAAGGSGFNNVNTPA